MAEIATRTKNHRVPATDSTCRKTASPVELARERIAIEAVSPVIDGGRFAAKTVAGWPLTIEADIMSDGHDVLGAEVLLSDGSKIPMEKLVNDRWSAEVRPHQVGTASFSLRAWRDLWASWSRDTAKKFAAGQDISLEIEEARLLLTPIEARGAGGEMLNAVRKALKARDVDKLLSAETTSLMARIGPRANLGSGPINGILMAARI